MKLCATCGLSKPLAAFPLNYRFKDGRLNHCKDCRNARDRERRLARTGVTPRFQMWIRKLVLLQFGLRYCGGCGMAKPLSHFYRNRATSDGIASQCKVCSSARVAALPLEQRNDRTRRWAQRHPDRARAMGQRAASARRARLRDVFVEHVDPRVLFERDEGICGICEEPVSDRFDVDHIVPLVAGGEHSYANTRIAHPSCNRAKGRQIAVALASGG